MRIKDAKNGSVIIYKILENAEIETIEELDKMSNDEILQLPNVNLKRMKLIRNFVNYNLGKPLIPTDEDIEKKYVYTLHLHNKDGDILKYTDYVTSEFEAKEAVDRLNSKNIDTDTYYDYTKIQKI